MRAETLGCGEGALLREARTKGPSHGGMGKAGLAGGEGLPLEAKGCGFP